MNWKRVLSVVLALVLVTTTLVGVVKAEARTRVIVRGVTLEAARGAVQAVDGVVESELAALNAVVAQVPDAKVTLLNGIPGVTTMVDRPVEGASLPAASGNGNAIDVEFTKTIGANEVWSQGVLGQGVTVAVLDTGIDPSMNGLKHGAGNNNRILAYYDAINDKFYAANKLNQSPKDPNGHGTHMASIIANSVYETQDGEYRGVAPAVNLVAVRVLDETGGGTYASVLRGLNWVIQNKTTYNIRVLNISMHARAYTPYWADPFDLAVMQAWAAGIVVVTSAGNNGPDPFSIEVPGNTPYVITVGAFTDNNTPEDFGDDFIPPFSAAGPTMDGFVKPDVIAPGAHIIAEMKNNSYLAQQYPDRNLPGNYFRMSGTSTAAAVTSGVVALMLSANPDLTPDQVKYRLSMTASPSFNPETGATLYSMWQQGMGRIWAPKAVFSPIVGRANKGLDIQADLAGEKHFAGTTFFDFEEGVFKVADAATGRYYTWDGTYLAPDWANLDGYPTWGDAILIWSDAMPTWSDAILIWSDAILIWSDGTPIWSGMASAWEQVFPIWSDGLPTWSEAILIWSDGTPIWSDAILIWSDAILIWSDGIPIWSDYARLWSDAILIWSDAILIWSDTTPTWDDAILIWSDGIPDWANFVLKWDDYGRAWSDLTQAWSDIQSAIAEGMPVSGDGTLIWSDSILIWSDGTLIWSDSIPIWSDGTLIWSDGTLIWSDGILIWSDGPVTWNEGTVTWSDGATIWTDGSLIQSDAILIWSDGTLIWSDGTPIWSDGTLIWSDGLPIWSDGTLIWSDGTLIWSDAIPVLSDGTLIWSDGTLIWSDGTLIWSDGTLIWSDGFPIWSDGTLIWSDSPVIWSDVWAGPEY